MSLRAKRSNLHEKSRVLRREEPFLAMTYRSQGELNRRMFGFMMGIVVGALIGSTVALLLAPETGDKFRNQIHARGEILINDLRHTARRRGASS